MENFEIADFSKGNCKIMWDRLVSKYAPHTALSLFHNSKLESMDKDPDEWTSNLEGLQICMNEFNLKGSITDEDFMIHVLNNLPKECDVILDRL